MSSSHSLDPQKHFTFPRNPKMTDIEFVLHQITHVTAEAHHHRLTERIGPLGGFGTLQNLDIETEVTDPVWIPEGDKGRWRESVKYTAYLILRCPPTINTRLIRTEVRVSQILTGRD
jgi:hypothetical protein